MAKSDIKVYALEQLLERVYPNRKELSQQEKSTKTIEPYEDIDHQIKKDFMDEDLSLLVNVPQNVLTKRIKRYQSAVKYMKEKHKFRCQICGETFTKDNGEKYCEAHHIVPLSLDGSQDSFNIIILCANHHRMFHYASNQIKIEPILNSKRKITINGQLFVISYN